MAVFAHEVERIEGPLTATERERLDQCEAVIARGLRQFVEVGNALGLICEQRLYRQEFQTFEDYCRERWDMSPSYAYRKVHAAWVMEVLSPIGDKVPLPANEAQTRPLTKLASAEAVQTAMVNSTPKFRASVNATIRLSPASFARQAKMSRWWLIIRLCSPGRRGIPARQVCSSAQGRGQRM
jgi:hypothetical protein